MSSPGSRFVPTTRRPPDPVGPDPVVVMSFGKILYRIRLKIFHDPDKTFPNDITTGRGVATGVSAPTARTVENFATPVVVTQQRDGHRDGVMPLPKVLSACITETTSTCLLRDPVGPGLSH